MKILHLGNSLTLHAPAPHLGWLNNCGMAASSPEKDYVHRLRAKIMARGMDVEEMIDNIADFERDPAGLTPDYVEKYLAFGPDVIVLRICENTPADKRAAFGEGYERLLGLLNADRKAAVFCTGAFWSAPDVDAMIQKAAEAQGAVFLSLTHLQQDRFRAIGLFEHAGVAGHPGDAGMEAIADTIFAAMEKQGLFAGK